MSTPKRGIGPLPEGSELTAPAKGKNYLLAIGIDRYEHFPYLNNAVRDAQTFAALLHERYQFEPRNTEFLFNEEATERQLLFKLRDMARLITPEDNLVIYFSGHGEFDQILNEGYWIPVDADAGAIEDYIPNSKIHTVLNAIRSRHTFLIVDSCFSGSLFMQFRSVAAGDRLEILPSRWGLTSGRNEIVPDGPAGHHSPFAEALLSQLRLNQVDLSVGELCQRVVESVAARSGQIPRGEPLRVNGHEGGQFLFRLKGMRAAADEAAGDTSSRPTRGGLLYSIPQAMEVGQESRCEVRIAFDKALLMEDLDIEKDHEIREIRISNLMEVALMDPASKDAAAFSVRTISTAEQFIDPDDYTQWIFYVKALREGIHPLVLKVTVIENMAGRERRKEIVLEEQVEVRTRLAEMPEEAGFSRGYTFEMGEKLPAPGLQVMPPPQSPVFEPEITYRQAQKAPARRTGIGWIRSLAAVMVVLLGVVIVWRLMLPSDNLVETDAPSEEAIRSHQEWLADARELLEQNDPDLKEAEELVQKARESFQQQKTPLPDSLVRQLKAVEDLLQQARQRVEEPSAEPEKPPVEERAPARPAIPDEQLADNRRSGEDAAGEPDQELFTDQRDGRQYPARLMGGQHWMLRNLAYATRGSTCYNENALLCQNLGALYNWEAAHRACPPGWHLPDPREWEALIREWGDQRIEKAYEALSYGGTSPFQAQLAGMQEPGGAFVNLYQGGYFWTSKARGDAVAMAVHFDKNTRSIRRMPMSRKAKLSCRCVRDVAN